MKLMADYTLPGIIDAFLRVFVYLYFICKHTGFFRCICKVFILCIQALAYGSGSVSACAVCCAIAARLVRSV